MERDKDSSNRKSRKRISQADRRRLFEETHEAAMSSIKAEAETRRQKTERLRKLRLETGK